MTFKTVADLIKANRWTGDGPTAFDSRSNYAGADLSDYVQVIGTNRDADTLTRCNFSVMLDRLGGENEEEGVKVGHFGHWACGWYELILVRADALDKLEIAREALNDLDSYPVLDEDSFSALEMEEAESSWDNWGESEFERIFTDTFGDTRGARLFTRFKDKLASAFTDYYQQNGCDWCADDLNDICAALRGVADNAWTRVARRLEQLAEAAEAVS